MDDKHAATQALLKISELLGLELGSPVVERMLAWYSEELQDVFNCSAAKFRGAQATTYLLALLMELLALVAVLADKIGDADDTVSRLGLELAIAIHQFIAEGRGSPVT